MHLFRRPVPFYQQKKFYIPLFIVLGLLAFRMILPGLIRIGLNSYLKDFSPSLKAHVGDVDLAILRGVYTLEDISVEIKKKDKEFLQVGSASARLAWKDVFTGNLVTDVFVDEADFTYTDSLIPAIQEHLKDVEKKEDKKDEKAKKEPFLRVSRFDLKDSVIRTDVFPALTKEEGIVLTKLEARATNVTPSEKLPLTPFSMQGLLLKSGKIKTTGEANLMGDKPRWTVDSEMKEFDLTSLNRFLKQKVPLTFTKGKLDLYAEVKSEGGPIKGYIKPFVKDLDVIKSKENFKNTKHWLAEIISALGNVVMKSRETMATKVPFTFDQTLKPDTDKTISKAVEHGFLQELNRGIENSINLDQPLVKQSQEDYK